MEALDHNVPPEAGHPLFEDHLQKEHIPKETKNVVEVSTPYSRKKQFLATLCATMGCFLNGGVIGYTGPAIPTMMHPNNTNIFGDKMVVSLQQISWITSILGLGAFLGALSSGYIMEKIGRKKMLYVVTSSTFAIGYLFILLAVNVPMLYIGRFFCGVGLGFQLCTSSVYIVEIATIDMRGFLGCFIQLMGCVGILFTFCVGYAINWKFLAVANVFWTVVFASVMERAPESPRWLLVKGREYSAMRSLEWLRGKDEREAIEREISIIKRDLANAKKQHVSTSELLKNWRPFLIALNMMFILNFSGFNVIIYYTINIFQYARTSVDPKLACIIVGVTLLVSCLMGIVFVAKLNRKIMLVSSILGMAICQFIIGYCMSHNEAINAAIQKDAENPNLEVMNLPANATHDQVVGHLRDHVHQFPDYLGWLPVVAVIGFLFLGNAGFGTLVWVVVAELLPPKIRSAANSFSICFGFVGGFLVAKTFVDLIQAIQNSGAFYLYSGICFVGFLYVAVFVPETKQKTQEEIQASIQRSWLQKIKSAFLCK